MKFGVVHHVLTTAFAMFGIVAVLGAAALHAWSGTIALGALGLVLLQIIRVATRRGATHDLQIVILALVHFLVGIALGGGALYGLALIGCVAIAPAALVLSLLRREVEANYRQGARDRSGLPVDIARIVRSRRVVDRPSLTTLLLLGAPTLVVAAAIFLAVPHLHWQALALDRAVPERMNLDETGILRLGAAPVMRVEVEGTPDPPPSSLPLRMRGTAFDSYDGHTWTRTPAEDVAASAHVAGVLETKDARRFTIDLEPTGSPLIFVPSGTLEIRAPFAIDTTLDGTRHVGSTSGIVRYEAVVAPHDRGAGRVLPEATRTRYLGVPNDTPARIASLAHVWTDGEPTPAAKARAIERHLRGEFTYDLRRPSGGKPQPIDDFLFVTRRGHCEFFSSAMALLLRAVGIPARNVTGFLGATYNSVSRRYVVRESDAHSWVEAYVGDPGAAWRTFDPTPGIPARPPETGALAYARDLGDAFSGWFESKLAGYDLPMQRALLARVESHGFAAATALVAALVLLALGRGRSSGVGMAWTGRYARNDADRAGSTGDVATTLYRGLERALASQGIDRAPGTTPLRLAEELAAREHPLADRIVSLTRVYLEARFGGRLLDSASRRDFERGVREVSAFQARTTRTR